MATRQIEMQYNLRQNNNDNSTAYGKWFPKAVRRSTLNLKGLAEHIQGHGSIYTTDVVTGVLTKFRDCLVELVTQGVGVKIDGIGTFYPTLEAKGADTPIKYNIKEQLEGIHLRFLPENSDNDKLTSRALIDKVVMKQNMIFDMNGVPKKIVDGQLVNYGENSDDDSDDDDSNEG